MSSQRGKAKPRPAPSRQQPERSTSAKGKEKTTAEPTAAQRATLRKAKLAADKKREQEEAAETRRLADLLQEEEAEPEAEEEEEEEEEEEDDGGASGQRDADSDVAPDDEDEDKHDSGEGEWATDLGIERPVVRKASAINAQPRASRPPPPSSSPAPPSDNDPLDDIDIVNLSPPRPPVKRTQSQRSPQQSKSVKKPKCRVRAGTRSSSPEVEIVGEETRHGKRTRKRKGDAQPRRRAPGAAKLSMAYFTEKQNALIDGAKQAFRASHILDDAFPEITSRTAYYRPILEAFVDSSYARSDLRATLDEVLADPDQSLFADICEMGEYPVSEGRSKFLEPCRSKIDEITQPDGVFDDELCETYVAFHKKTMAFHYGEYDVKAETINRKTPFIAAWLPQLLRRFTYENTGGLDGYTVYRIEQMGGPTKEMWALMVLSRYHSIVEWQTGAPTHIVFSGSPKSDAATTYTNILSEMAKIETQVPGWWEHTSKKMFKMAAKQSNKEWRLKELAASKKVGKHVDFDGIRAEMEAEQAANQQVADALGARLSEAA